MTTDEIKAAYDRFMARVTAILTAEELAIYKAYWQRLEASVAQHDPRPVAILPAEQAVLDRIAADTEAAALRKAYSVLIGLEKLPQ
jgi:hypothetical protein